MKRKIAYILLYTFLVLTILGGVLGLIYELLPDRSIIPDLLFNIVFISQFVILAGLFLSGFLVKKWKK